MTTTEWGSSLSYVRVATDKNSSEPSNDECIYLFVEILQWLPLLLPLLMFEELCWPVARSLDSTRPALLGWSVRRSLARSLARPVVRSMAIGFVLAGK